MAFGIHQREAIVAASAAATVYALPRSGFESKLPALGGVSPALMLIAIGVFLAVVYDGSGTVGDVSEGVGYGLIALGAASYGAA